MSQFKCLLTLLKWRAQSPPVQFCFHVRWETSVRVAQTMTQGSRHVQTMGNTPTKRTSTENILVNTYTNMYARYQSSLGYLAWHYCCMSVTEGKIRGKYHQETNVPRSNLAISRIHKNKERHTAHAIISWPNPKQRMIVHISGFMIAFI